MVYDAGLPEKDRVTYADPPIVSEHDALVPFGLKEAKISCDHR